MTLFASRGQIKKQYTLAITETRSVPGKDILHKKTEKDKNDAKNIPPPQH